jgi:FXSXX-COOH protein
VPHHQTIREAAVVDVSVARGQHDEPVRRSSDLIDLAGLTLANVLSLDDSVVANSLRRILREIDQPQDAVAGFQSAM